MQSYIDEAEQYKVKREMISARETEIEQREKRVNNRLEEINRLLVHFENQDSESDEKVNVSKLETRRSTIDTQLDVHNQTVGASKNSFNLCNDEIDRINKEIDKAKDTLKERVDAEDQLAVVKMMQKYFQQVFEVITGGMKAEIEATTRKIFEDMNWKTKTFGKILIGDDYSVSVFDQEGLEMTASLKMWQ